MALPKAEALRYWVGYFTDGAIFYARILGVMCWALAKSP
jgi:hypothetical protein